MRAERREETAAALREQLHAADAGIDVPDGLWDRVRAPREGTPVAVRTPLLRRRPVPFAVIAVAAAAVVLVVCGTWWLVAPPSTGSGPAQDPAAPHPPEHAVTLRVHNAEVPCRKLRTMECSLRIAKNPFQPYANPDNAVGRVWHGDRLSASCVVTDGQLIKDENGLSSTRWYRVSKAHGEWREGATAGWLPGVRTRNTTEVPGCSGSERPSK